MDVVSEILEKSAKETDKYKSITVNKHLELEYDIGNLLAFDNNDLNVKSLNGNRNDYLLNLTRDNVQLLLNKVWELPTERIDEAIVVRLPTPKFVLPRSRPVPKPKPLTKWQEFAKLKGIQKKKKPKLSWDDQLQKWVPLFGYKRAVVEKAKDWVLEVPDNANPMEDQFTKKKSGKEERVSKNELQRLRNVAKARNIKVPRVGLTTPDASSAKVLQTAITVARSSTASLGKFQDKLPKEKEARGVNELIPGASRKRKLPALSSEQERNKNMTIIDSVLNKRPKLNIEKAVARHINKEEVQRSEEKISRPKAGKMKSTKSNKNSKKPMKKSQIKNHKKGKKGGGRKRR